VSDPFAPTLSERIRQSRNLVLALGVVLAILGTAAYYAAKVQAITPSFEQATVVSFGMESGRIGNRPIMRVVTAFGDQRTINVAPRVLRSCEMGEQVLLQRRGMNLRVAPEACELAGNKS